MSQLVAMMIVRNEADRYLEPCLDHLLEFCDGIYLLDDGSTDDTPMLADRKGVHMMRTEESNFYVHEGRARQMLLEHTIRSGASHILAIDADEFVSNGYKVRRAMEETSRTVWTLNMQEIWQADENGLAVRQDGGWKEHGVPVMFSIPPGPSSRARARAWRIPDKALACGRIPIGALVRGKMAGNTEADLLHFGWTCEADRAARYQRYVEHDSGQFHQRRHLDSIMWTGRQVRMTRRAWPKSFDATAVLARASRP